MRHLSAVVESVKSELVQWPLRISSGQIKSFFDSTVLGGVDSFCLQHDVALFLGKNKRTPLVLDMGTLSLRVFLYAQTQATGLGRVLQICTPALEKMAEWLLEYSFPANWKCILESETFEKSATFICYTPQIRTWFCPNLLIHTSN